MKTTIAKTTKAASHRQFGNSRELLQKIKRQRPDLIQAALGQPLNIIIGKNLLRLRREAALTRTELSRLSENVGARTIQRIEEAGADSNPTIRVIENLARALGVFSTDLTDPIGTIIGERGRP